jgi:POT family proton-dependent oligopeptide transporter
MPAGDATEGIAGAELRAEAIDEKRNSLAIAETTQHAASLAGSQGHIPPEGEAPTAEDLVTLRRVATKIPLKLFSIAFIEMCERFSYYGTTIVCKLTTGRRIYPLLKATRDANLLTAHSN